MRISSSRVTATSGANFRAIAQRGSRSPIVPSSVVQREAVDLHHHAVGREGQGADSVLAASAIAACTAARSA